MNNTLPMTEAGPGHGGLMAGLIAVSIVFTGALAGEPARADGLTRPAPHQGLATKKMPQRSPRVPISTGETSSLWTVRSRYDTIIHATASRHEVDPALVKAIVQAESAFDPRAVSRSGARGLMQVLPETALRFAITNLADPRQNLEAGVRYLKHLLGLFDGNVIKAVAAYNAGPNTVRRYRGVPPYRETRGYLAKVMELRAAYADQLRRS